MYFLFVPHYDSLLLVCQGSPGGSFSAEGTWQSLLKAKDTNIGKIRVIYKYTYRSNINFSPGENKIIYSRYSRSLRCCKFPEFAPSLFNMFVGNTDSGLSAPSSLPMTPSSVLRGRAGGKGPWQAWAWSSTRSCAWVRATPNPNRGWTESGLRTPHSPLWETHNFFLKSSSFVGNVFKHLRLKGVPYLQLSKLRTCKEAVVVSKIRFEIVKEIKTFWK